MFRVLCWVSKFRINSVCVRVICCRRCSLLLSIFRASSYSVSTVCVTPPCARSGNKRFPGSQPSWLPAPTSLTDRLRTHWQTCVNGRPEAWASGGTCPGQQSQFFFVKKIHSIDDWEDMALLDPLWLRPWNRDSKASLSISRCSGARYCQKWYLPPSGAVVLLPWFRRRI